VVKFLSGSTYSGERIKTCTFWRSDLTTNKTKDYADISSTDVGGGSCVANAFFKREDISCFNSGDCNSEGKCLPCTKYKYGGMQLGISHSPPLTVLKEFNKGITDDDLRSPNKLIIGKEIATRTDADQLPFHVVLRNIQAGIAKCCHWSAGNGTPSKFYLAKIIKGNATKTYIEYTTLPQEKDSAGNPVKDKNGRVIDPVIQEVKTDVPGIYVTNTAFDDKVGSFFPVGTVVLAGFEDQPSFYLEPRTGLMKPGEDVIFLASAADSYLTKAKKTAVKCTQPTIDAVNAARTAKNTAVALQNEAINYYNQTLLSNEPDLIASAKVKSDLATANAAAASAAYTQATILGNSANVTIGDIVNAEVSDDITVAAKVLADTLDALAAQVTITANCASGTSAGNTASMMAGKLVILARAMRSLGYKGASKCELFFTAENVAKQWNAPTDGSLPCNGVRTECQFYTGPVWAHATDEKLEVGKSIIAEQLQELRFYSDDWTRYTDPFTTFRNRFSTPYIWAFKEYLDSGGTPEIGDMALYKPKLLFSKIDTTSAAVQYDTASIERVSISDFTTFAVEKTRALIQPGSPSLDNKDKPPAFPTVITRPGEPSDARLKITHPRLDKKTGQEVVGKTGPFILRNWSENRNTATLFGTATPGATIFLVNETALQRRFEYNAFYETQNTSLPESITGIPGAPDFSSAEAVASLVAFMTALEEEKSLNTSEVPNPFAKFSADYLSGQWASINEIGLVYNEINKIYAFIFLSDTAILFDYTLIDFRLLHSVIAQTVFEGEDFSMFSEPGSTKLGDASNDTVAKGFISAQAIQTVGRAKEIVKLSYGYYAWREVNRGLTLAASTGTGNPDVVLESEANAFISRQAYQVVQYRKTITLEDGWYTINDCGYIMVPIPDLNVHRVLPLPNVVGSLVGFQNVLTNYGGRGSVVAQWAIESASLNINDTKKNLLQYYRDTDGRGLPANYVILGPDTNFEQAYGRPVPGRDSIEITFTFLRSQTCSPAGLLSVPELAEDVVEQDFYKEFFSPSHPSGDKPFCEYKHAFSFDVKGTLTAGGVRGSGESVVAITKEQQEYVWVFADSEGRPIGKKYSRLLVMYSNLSCISVDIFYRWKQSCIRYALMPELSIAIGTAGGTLLVAPRATVNPADLQLGSRYAAGYLGDNTCDRTPSCGDHEHGQYGSDLAEIEYSHLVTPTQTVGGETIPAVYKMYYPSAGQVPPAPISSEADEFRYPGDTWRKLVGPVWYPYTACENARYYAKTNAAFGTDSTELINKPLTSLAVGPVITSIEGEALNTATGNRPPASDEAYRGIDRVTAEILDTHPSLRACSSEYTYGNLIAAGQPVFDGYARRRGQIDLFWYSDHGFAPPPFGNFGRNMLMFEVSDRRGDYLGDPPDGGQGFRWMPIFPTRDNIGSNIDILSESLEVQHYRLQCMNNPAGGGTEGITNTPRYTHRALIENKIGAVDYPYVPYWPKFLADASLGKEPAGRAVDAGPISTQWAWREKAKPIKRGQAGSSIIKGLALAAPDYILDHQRLEVSLRPAEGEYTLTYEGPKHDQYGALTKNGTLRLGSGPPREIIIDFANQIFGLAPMIDTVYDLSQTLGGSAFPCIPGTPIDTPSFGKPCSCTGDITDPQFQNGTQIPAIFTHLDNRSTLGYSGLYSEETMSAPFGTDLPRTTTADPSVMGNYYIKGIGFKLDYDFIPVTAVNPMSDSRAVAQYTWSRTPHGTAYPNEGGGVDGSFGTAETNTDVYKYATTGKIFTSAVASDALEISSVSGDIAAFFPSPLLAHTVQTEKDTTGPKTTHPITVLGILPSGDLKLKGHTPCTDIAAAGKGYSNGEPEQVVLNMTFLPYMRITKVTISFAAGKGMQVPRVSLGVVDPVNRTGSLPTVRTARVIGESIETATGMDLGLRDSSLYSQTALNEGRTIFRVTIVPSYQDMPFWNQFGQEFELIFADRDNEHSMGIIGIALEAAMVSTDGAVEIIFIPARKYYVAKGDSTNNPEQVLEGVDSATAYWRTTSTSTAISGNRYRAYAWDEKIEDNQPPIKSTNIKELEALQSVEYNKTLALMGHTFSFSSFIPFEESAFLTFLKEGEPSWQLEMRSSRNRMQDVKKYITSGKTTNATKLWGTIPEREPWSAPGHAWTHKLEEDPDFSTCGAVSSWAEPYKMIIFYQFLHLHDELAVFQPAEFWSSMPSSMSRTAQANGFVLGGGLSSQKDVGILHTDT